MSFLLGEIRGAVWFVIGSIAAIAFWPGSDDDEPTETPETY